MQPASATDHRAPSAVQTTRQLINEPCFCAQHRMRAQDFTRRRHLTFSTVMTMVLQKTIRSIQLHLNDFFEKLLPFGPTVTVAAWSDARLKLSYTAFIELNQRAILEVAYAPAADALVRRWRAHRLLAIDSSLVRLPNREQLGREFGWVESHNQAGAAGKYPQGRLSVLTDVLNRIALDSAFVPWQQGERDLAIGHIAKMHSQDVALLDRGFAAYELWAHFVAKKHLFVCRCPSSSFSEVNRLFQQNQAGVSVVIRLQPSSHQRRSVRAAQLPEDITVRLVTVRLKTGELEVLATNLLDGQQYPTADFAELYHYRWGIETYYGLLKGRLDLENFSGLSSQAVRQDIFATIFLSNLESLLIAPAQEQLRQKSQTTKHAQQVNHAVSFHTIKSHLLELLLGSEPLETVLPKLQSLFLGNPVSVRPERIVARKKRSAWRSYNFQRNTRKAVF